MTSNNSHSHSTGSEYMNVLAEMTEKMTEQALTTMNRSQQAAIEAVANWAQSTQALMPQPLTADALQAMPKPTELVDRSFEIAEQLLTAQRSFATELMESLQGPLADAAAKTSAAAKDVSDAGAASTKAGAQGAGKASDPLTKTVKHAFSKD